MLFVIGSGMGRYPIFQFERYGNKKMAQICTPTDFEKTKNLRIMGRNPVCLSIDRYVNPRLYINGRPIESTVNVVCN